MSKQILKALMQLFAIIARPESNKTDRRTVVESFLSRQLNRELVKEYLKIFDDNYQVSQQKQKDAAKRNKRTSSISVRILAICTRINEELTHRQKVIVMVNLFEFVKSDKDIVSEQEIEFISSVAETFNISGSEFQIMKDFVVFPFNNVPDSGDILVIDNVPALTHSQSRHIGRTDFPGQARIMRITNVNMYLVRYIGDGEMYLNSQPVMQDKVYVFDNGSSIRNQGIKPVYYSEIVSAFSPHPTKSKIIFSARDISYNFKGGKKGLCNITFSGESGHLTGIMGSSGSGKTTLLNVLNGSLTPAEGKVLINGIDIHREKEKIGGLIGHVSQDDLLIEELTVYQNLYFNARLCFDDYTTSQKKEAVNKLLKQLGLFGVRDIQVGTPLDNKISGGQRKRLNIALELIREPSILFLDEPTSGLSSRDSENIMDLVKELSLKGKLVFVVIHQPSSDIFKMFDRLLILDTGGYLIYNGDPVEAITCFKSHVQHANWKESECHACGNVNPEQLFNIIETNVLDEYGKQTEVRRISPPEWAQLLRHNRSKKEASVPALTGLPEVSFSIPGRYRQFLIFSGRDILAKLANRQYIIINLFEAPLLAVILSFLLKYHDVGASNHTGYTFAGNVNFPVYLFISVIVAIFIGLTVSAEEIIKDRKMLKREAFLNLSWSGYLSSKIVVLFTISAIQALLFVLAGNYITEIKGMFFHYWLVLFSVWCFSNVLGLIISDSFKTVITIYILIPFLVIPQLILSGVIVKFEEMNPSLSSPDRIPVYGEIITARWAYEALAVWQFTNNEFEKEFYPYNKAISKAGFMNNFWISNLQNKVVYCEKNLDDTAHTERVAGYYKILVNELGREQKQNRHVMSDIDFEGIRSVFVTEEFLIKAGTYLEKLYRYYQNLYTSASRNKDILTESYISTAEGRDSFLERKDASHNEALSELVRNARSPTRIIEYNGRLYRKSDPVYRDPEGRFIRAHFYSPEKRLFGFNFSTLWVNVMVIWFMTFILSVILYFRLLRKGLDEAEGLIDRFRKAITGR